MDDQTEQSWLRNSSPGQLGTAILLVPLRDPERPHLFEAIDMSDVTYGDAKLTAQSRDAEAVKWVPHFIADYTTLRMTACGDPCTKTCVEAGCICDKATKRCVRAK